jgi:hypothetical protein
MNDFVIRETLSKQTRLHLNRSLSSSLEGFPALIRPTYIHWLCLFGNSARSQFRFLEFSVNILKKISSYESSLTGSPAKSLSRSYASKNQAFPENLLLSIPSFSSLPTVFFNMSSRHSQPRKRQLSRSYSSSESSVEISQAPKGQGSHPPAEFWDNLSKIWLTTGALRELDRRNSSTPRFDHAESKKKREHLQFAPEFLRDCSPTSLEEIRNLAESGGPDLTDLRGVSRCLLTDISVC